MERQNVRSTNVKSIGYAGNCQKLSFIVEVYINFLMFLKMFLMIL